VFQPTPICTALTCKELWYAIKHNLPIWYAREYNSEVTVDNEYHLRYSSDGCKIGDTGWMIYPEDYPDNEVLVKESANGWWGIYAVEGIRYSE
jgi:hypothetical protein